MSYDIDLFYLPHSSDPAKEARQLTIQPEKNPYPEEEVRRRKIFEDLLTLYPSLKMDAEKRGFAFGSYIYSDENDSAVPIVEFGVDLAFISFSYSSDPDPALASVKQIIAVFERHGYVAYDPQIEDIVSSQDGLTRSSQQFSSTHDAVVRHLEKMGETVIEHVPKCQKQKPWWKFW